MAELRPDQGSRARHLTEGHRISRRSYLKMMVGASGGLLLATAGLASGIFRKRKAGAGRVKKIAEAVPPGGMATFSYPGENDPAIAMRLSDGRLVAFSSACTHLSCAVLWMKAQGRLICPCHNGAFDDRTGEVVEGPPPRPLTKIRLREGPHGVYAVGTEE